MENAVENAVASEQPTNEQNGASQVPETGQKLEALENKDTSQMTKTEKKEHEKKVEKFRLKVFGKEWDEELDLNNKDEITRRLQKAAAADIRMQESANLKKNVERFVDELRKNPRKALSDPNLNIDIRKMAQEIIEEEIANAQKSPEQLEKERLQNELETLKNKYKEDEDTRKKTEFERLQAETEQKLESDIGGALETGGLPKTPYTVQKMANLLMIALQNDIELSAADVVPLVKKQMQEDIKEMFSMSSDDLFEEMFKDNISRVRKKNVSKAKQQVESPNGVRSVGEKPKEDIKKDATKKTQMRDFFGF